MERGPWQGGGRGRTASGAAVLQRPAAAQFQPAGSGGGGRAGGRLHPAEGVHGYVENSERQRAFAAAVLWHLLMCVCVCVCLSLQGNSWGWSTCTPSRALCCSCRRRTGGRRRRRRRTAGRRTPTRGSRRRAGQGGGDLPPPPPGQAGQRPLQDQPPARSHPGGGQCEAVSGGGINDTVLFFTARYSR